MPCRTSFASRAAALLAVALTVASPAGTAQAAGTIKAAYVETAIPSRTYFGHMSVLNAVTSTGPGTGVLGVTSLTLTNFDSTAQQVFIFTPLFAGSTCSSPVVGGGNPQMTVYVPPQATLHLTFPTPLVFNPVDGLTCIGAEVTTLLHGGSVHIEVNGVIN